MFQQQYYGAMPQRAQNYVRTLVYITFAFVYTGIIVIFVSLELVSCSGQREGHGYRSKFCKKNTPFFLDFQTYDRKREDLETYAFQFFRTMLNFKNFEKKIVYWKSRN